MKVLLVDDDRAFVLGATELLTAAGHDVDVAWNGSEALIAVAQDQPAVVVLDYRLPGMQGDATAGLLRSLRPGIKIIGISAVEDVDGAWANDFIRKDEILTRLLPVLEAISAD